MNMSMVKGQRIKGREYGYNFDLEFIEEKGNELWFKMVDAEEPPVITLGETATKRLIELMAKNEAQFVDALPDTNVIKIGKGTLKARGKGWVFYDVEYFRKHWSRELALLGIDIENEDDQK